MFQGIQNGWTLFKASTKTFIKFPIFLVPILVVWLFYAPATIYLKWYFPWDNYSTFEKLPIIFLICFGFALLLTLSCAVLLGLIQERETGKKFDLPAVLVHALAKNIIAILALSFVWAIIWFILTILEAIFRRKSKKGSKSGKISVENVAGTLGGKDGGSTTFRAIEKAVRMTVFLVMPAFIWENYGIRNGYKRAMAILNQRKAEFITGFALSELVTMVIFLPPGIMFFLDDHGMDFPDGVWFVCIIYIAFGWSYSIYLEQMFTAELYLWQLKWERAVKKAEAKKITPPTFDEMAKPTILDDINDLLDDEKNVLGYP